jgi:hypothetical protein
MPTASFSLLPSPLSFFGSIANTLLFGYLVNVLHKLTKKVLFSEFTRWNEIKRYHVIATVLGIGSMTVDILKKLGCSAVKEREGLYPLECNILVVALELPLQVGNILIFVESAIFSYCRLYMILPGIFCDTL